jgi:membrane protease subunit HflK
MAEEHDKGKATPKRSPWGKSSAPQRGNPFGNSSGGGAGGGNGGGDDGRKGGADFEDMFRKQQQKMRSVFQPDNGNESRIALLAAAGVVLLWLSSGIYRVNSDELGVVLRFGEYHRTTNPGLNYHLPYPVETVLIPSVTSVNRLEIGSGNGKKADKESLMLTGDRNIVNIDFEVQWKIDAVSPQHFLFNVRDPEGTVRAVAESAMREVIGRNKLEEILTSAQSKIADDTQQIMQEMLNQYHAGIEVIAVNLSRPDVPQPVIDEFQDVKRAEQDKATAESVAEGYRNDILPRAKGEAVKMVQDAEAYKNRVIAEAKGDVARFGSIYDQYILAKDVTRKRMYLETMEQVMKGMNKVIVEQKGSGVVPVLPLPSLVTPAPSVPSATVKKD